LIEGRSNRRIVIEGILKAPFERELSRLGSRLAFQRALQSGKGGKSRCDLPQTFLQLAPLSPLLYLLSISV
jgi:hypothetical protein